MKCPMCLGKGYATDEDIKEYPHRCPNCNGKGFYAVDWQKVRCEVCNGSGKKPMTNEEYIKSLNTEQLAECLTNISFSTGYDSYNVVRRKIMEWLKRPYQKE